jgi:branched-chain amino acid transport system substrate-binding protein
MRLFKLVSLIVLVALVLTACAQPTAAPAPAAPAAKAEPTKAPAAAAPAAAAPAATGGDLKVAVLAPLSGAVPTFGVMTRDGALLAIEEWNAKGGVNGKKVVPIVEDSQCTPDPAVNAANKVIDQDKVKFIVGEVCSKASIPISEIANAKKVIQISPTSTNTDVTVTKDGKTKDYIFRACFIDPFQGKVGAKFAMDNLKAKNAFIMLDQSNDYVRGLAEEFEKAFTAAGGKIVGKETYTSKDTDFSAILSKVAAAKPDVIYLPDYYNIVNLATKQAKEKGITAPFVGGDGWDSSDLDKAAAAGGYFTNHYSPDSTAAEAVAFQKAFSAKYKGATPDALAALAYDATNLLLNSIKNAGSDDTDKVKAAMEALSMPGVSGKITFDKQHNPIKSATILKVTPDKVVFDSTVNP